MPWTLLLIGAAMGLASIVGVLAGISSGWRRGKNMDRGLLTRLLSGKSVFDAWYYTPTDFPSAAAYNKQAFITGQTTGTEIRPTR